MIRFALPVFIIAVSAASLVSAKGGNHYGWCNGVGNPHGNSSCGGPSPSIPPGGTGLTPGEVPTANPLPTTTTSVPTPSVTPVLVPSIAPNAIPGQVPVLVPPMVPQPVPQRVPTAIPQQVPTPMTVPGLVLPRPKVKPQTNPKPLVSTGVMPNPVQTVPPQTGQVRPPVVTQPHPAQVVVPPMVPMLVPQRVPQAIPQPIPQRVPTLAPTVTHRPQVRPVGIGRELITSTPGRQPAHNPPAFQGKAQGEQWNCVASGHGKRKSVEDGKVVSNGALRHVGSVDVLGRDLPALHPRHPHCIVSVKRRKR